MAMKRTTAHLTVLLLGAIVTVACGSGSGTTTVAGGPSTSASTSPIGPTSPASEPGGPTSTVPADGPTTGNPVPGEPTTTPPSPPTPAGELVIQVREEGGFVPVEFLARRLPVVSVYADGRVITQGAQILIYPGPALPSVQVRTAPDDELASALADTRAAIAGAGDTGLPPVADVPDTVFEVVDADGASSTVRVAALGFDSVGLTPQQIAARRALADVRDRLVALGGPDSQMYTASSLSAFASPYGDSGGEPAPNELDWPLAPIGPGGPDGMPVCIPVTGADTATVRSALDQATEITRWRSGGQVWSIAFRPALPHESPCPAPR